MSGEAAERSVIGRAYYACYGKAWQYARSKGASLTHTGRDHTLVWDWFSHGAGAVRVSIGADGKRLKGWRIKADYHRVYPSASADARLALITATQLLANLATLR